MSRLERALSCAGILKDENLWSEDLHRYSHGRYSFAVVKANAILQDFSEIQTAYRSTFVGIYDGHGGHLAAEFLARRLYRRIIQLATREGGICTYVITTAFKEIEAEFIDSIRADFRWKPDIAANGSCCLVGIIHLGKLWIANLGDSRAVLCKEENGVVSASPLTVDHNVNNPVIRDQVIAAHPNDRNVVIQVNNRHRIKGLIEVSRAIGDANLKLRQFRLGNQYPKYHVYHISRPLITAEPEIINRNLEATDRFIIFASDGLWEHLSNEEAVEIVRTNRRKGIAKELIKAAMRKGASEQGRDYIEIKKITGETRRRYHDDISVIVLFIDYVEPPRKRRRPRLLALNGFMDNDVNTERRFGFTPFEL